jgi:hypothetical protein
MTQKMEKQALWWWAGDEAGARRRFRERFGREAMMIMIPQSGIVAVDCGLDWPWLFLSLWIVLSASIIIAIGKCLCAER